MYIKIENNILTGAADWPFRDSTYVDIDYNDYDKDSSKYVVIDGVLVDISDTPEYIAEQEQREYERIQALTLTQRQLRLYLLNEWKLSDLDIKPWLDEKGRIEWDWASVFVRNNPLFDDVAKALGKTSKDVDIMFEDAAKL